ncbi:MAG: PAS domain S-box protein, partial [Desulfosudaceae bacterium]
HNYPPYEYLDEEGRPAGYNVDLTRAIARAVGLDVEIRLGPWSEVREGLRRGKIDALQGMLYSTERDRQFDFTQPHTVNHYVGVVRTRDAMPPSTVQELRNKRLVVQRGDIMDDFLRKNDLESRAVLVDAQEDALRKLAGGKYDCALVSRLIAHYWIEQRGWDNLTAGRRPLVSADYCYAVPNGHKAMRSTLSEGLKILDQTGEYQRIHDRWLRVYQKDAVDFSTIFRYTIIVLLPLVLILLAVMLWIWLLRRQVAEKTRALEESLARFKHIFEAANVGKSITQPDGSIEANQAYADFLGYTRAELAGKKWQDLTPAEDIAVIEKIIDPLLAGIKDAARFEKRYRHKNGHIRWADVSTSVYRDAQENPLYFLTTMVDITERKQTEEALRASEEFQRAMIECSPVALYSVDRNGRVLTWNSSAERMFGWSAGEVIGRLLPIVPDDMGGEFDDLREQVMSGHSFFARELTRQDKEGNRIPIRLSAAPIRNDRGEIVGVMAAAEDISEQERLSAQLSQAQKLESVGRLAGGVAHDYNNMLNVIIGYTELARDKLAPDDPLQEDLQEISDAARRSAEITRQLLAFARRQTIAPRILDLNETVENMLKMLRRLIGEDVDLSWEPGPALWPVKMDPAQVDQILANLLINARDAITGIGRITIETANVRLDENYCADRPGFVPGDYVMLAVSDDGCGMDKKTRDNLFEPFFTTKGVGSGTGLGLSTVYGIVRQNNGFINVYSEPGQGATFKIYLPRHAGEKIEDPAVLSAQIPQGHGETILVVEDEEAVLKLAQKILTGLGYTVLTASSPTAALKLAGEIAEALDLLMTDVVMPEMNGQELAEKMQALIPGGLKILFTSGYTANVIAHHGILDKGVHFIQKPFNRTDLARKVKEALEE